MFGAQGSGFTEFDCVGFRFYVQGSGFRVLEFMCRVEGWFAGPRVWGSLLSAEKDVRDPERFLARSL